MTATAIKATQGDLRGGPGPLGLRLLGRAQRHLDLPRHARRRQRHADAPRTASSRSRAPPRSSRSRSASRAVPRPRAGRGVLRRRRPPRGHASARARSSWRGRPGHGRRASSTIAGITKEVTATGTYQEPIDGPRRQRARRVRAGDDVRPPRLRLRLADGAAERRRRPRLGRTLNVHLELIKAGRRTRSDEHEGPWASPDRCGATPTTPRLLRAAAELLPPGAELELVEIGDLPLYNEDLDTDPAPAAVAAPARGDRLGRRDRDQHPRVQRLDPGRAEERDRLGLAPFPRQRLQGQAGAGDRRLTGLFGAVWAQAEVRKVLDHIGADVLDTELPVGQAHEAFGDAELRRATPRRRARAPARGAGRAGARPGSASRSRPSRPALGVARPRRAAAPSAASTSAAARLPAWIAPSK